MTPVLLALFLAAPGLRFDVVDAKGRKPPVSVEAGKADADGWCALELASKFKARPGKPQPAYVLVWPFDGRAKMADGPGEIPVLVVESGDPKVLENPRIVAALAAAELLGRPADAGLDAAALRKAYAGLPRAEDPFAKGVGLLMGGKAADALEPLQRALRERERQLTRVPSEIYPAAMLLGKASLAAGKFDPAAVAFLKALQQRPASEDAAQLRREALEKAGKADAR